MCVRQSVWPTCASPPRMCIASHHIALYTVFFFNGHLKTAFSSHASYRTAPLLSRCERSSSAGGTRTHVTDIICIIFFFFSKWKWSISQWAPDGCQKIKRGPVISCLKSVKFYRLYITCRIMSNRFFLTAAALLDCWKHVKMFLFCCLFFFFFFHLVIVCGPSSSGYLKSTRITQ